MKGRKEKRENPRNRHDLDLSPFDGVPAARALHPSASDNFVISIEREATKEGVMQDIKGTGVTRAQQAGVLFPSLAQRNEC